MKNFRLNLLVITILFTSLFQSCQKENSFENDDQSFKNPFEQVGVEHNNTVKNILSELQGSTKEDKIDFTNSYLSNQLDKGFLNKSNIIPKNYNQDIIDYNVYYSGKTLYQAFLENNKTLKKNDSNQIFTDMKDNVQNEVNEVLDFLESNNLTLSQIIENIEAREILAEEKFEEEDLETIYSFYSTMRHSANYWAPKSEGGEGGFDNFINIQSRTNYSKSSQMRREINWWKVGGCDAVGALVGCRGGIWGAVITGAGASVISIIMQW